MGDLPEGRRLRLGRRGTTFVRDRPGPPGAPTIVLLHGLGATAAINWPGAFDALAPHARVVALDHRGHGRGLRSPWPFRLEDCADDVVAVADALGVERVIAVGYSMGGPIAMLTRRRHADRVAGLVLCATSARFSDADEPAPAPLGGILATSMRLTPPALRQRMARQAIAYAGREMSMSPVFVEEVGRHDPAAVLEAAAALRRFDARPWLSELDCPTASVITERDRLVPPRRQLELARATGAAIFPLAGDHDIAVRSPDRFLPALVGACRLVTRRLAAAS